MLIITGMHRSGTTFLGKVLEKSGSYRMIHEPFNYVFGIEGINVWYPYIDIYGSDNKQLKELLDKLYRLEIRFKKADIPSDNLLKKLIRKFIYSKGHLDLIKYKLFNKIQKREVLLKDPFLSMCAGYLANNYEDVRVIYIIRHPVAIYNSIKRMNWDFDFTHILQQNSLVTKLMYNDIDIIKNKTLKLHEKVAFLWKVLYTVILNQHKLLPQKTLLIKHEDFSTEPYIILNRIEKFVSKSIINKKLEKFIQETMFAENEKIDNKKLHNFKRNSKLLAYSWRESMKPEYYDIIEINKEILKVFGYED